MCDTCKILHSLQSAAIALLSFLPAPPEAYSNGILAKHVCTAHISHLASLPCHSCTDRLLYRQTAAPCMLITRYTCTACCAVVLLLPSNQLVTALAHIATQRRVLCAVHGGVSLHCGRSQHSSFVLDRSSLSNPVQPAGVLQQALTTTCLHSYVRLTYHHCAAD